jgi:hypothetical protein
MRFQRYAETCLAPGLVLEYPLDLPWVVPGRVLFCPNGGSRSIPPVDGSDDCRAFWAPQTRGHDCI